MGPYGSGPTAKYSIYLYIVVASEYTTLSLIMISIYLRVLTSVTRLHLSQPLWIAARYVVTVKGKKRCGNCWAIPPL